MYFGAVPNKYVDKYYMNSIGSIVYIPEQHWGESVTVDGVQIKNDSTLIAAVTVEVEANADFAAFAMGKGLSEADFAEGNVENQREYLGTSTFEVEAPADESMRAYLYTTNKYNEGWAGFYSQPLSTYKSLGYFCIDK